MKASASSWELWTCDNEQDAARLCAELLTLQLNQRLDNQPAASLFVSGGKSPVPVFERLALADLPWSRIDIHLVDERFAPQDQQQQNARLVRQHLLQGKAAKSRFHDLLREPSLEESVLAANARTATIDQPDVVLLGMGLDGHTASLFPDAPDYPAAICSTDHYVAVHPKAAPHPRISMSQIWISQARSLLLFIPGAEKWQAFQHFVLKGQGISPVRPLLEKLGDSATIIATGDPSS